MNYEPHLNDEIVPRYDKNGRLLSRDEREKIAQRKGICLDCGVTVINIRNALRRKPITSDDVWSGICIRCNWTRGAASGIPAAIIDSWRQRNRHPPVSAHVTQADVRPAPTNSASSTSLLNAPVHYSPPNKQRQRGASPPPSNRSLVEPPLTTIPAAAAAPAAAAHEPAKKPGAYVCHDDSPVYRKEFETATGTRAAAVGSRPRTNVSNSGGGNNSNHETRMRPRGDRKPPPAAAAGEESKREDAPTELIYDNFRRENSNNSVNSKMSESGSSRLKIPSSASNLSARSMSSNGEQDVSDSYDPLGNGSNHQPRSSHGKNHSGNINGKKVPPDSNGYSYDRDSFGSRGSTGGRSRDGGGSAASNGHSYAHNMSKVSERPGEGDDDDTNSSFDPFLRTGRPIQNVPSEDYLGGVTPAGSGLAATCDPMARTGSGGSLLRNKIESQGKLIQLLEQQRTNPEQLRKTLHRVRNSTTKVLKNHPELIATTFTGLKNIMDTHRDDPRVMDVAAGALWRLNASTNGAICSTEYLGLIQNAEVQVQNLSRDNLDSGFVFLVIDSIRKLQDNASVLEWGLGALTSMASTTDGKDFIAHADGIEAVVEVLEKQQRNPVVFEWVCRFLFNMIYEFDEAPEQRSKRGFDGSEIIAKNCAVIVEAYGAAKLVDAMQHHYTISTVLLWATRVLCRLVDPNREPASSRMALKQVKNNKFVPLACKILRQQLTSPELWEGTSELLCYVFIGSNDPLLYEDAASSITTIVRKMGESNNEDAVLKSACQVLAAFTNGGPESKQQLKDQNAADKITDVMVTFIDDESVIQTGSWALWKLSAEPSFLSGPAIRRALAMFASVNLRYQDSAKILRTLVSFAANVCDNPSTTLTDFPFSALIRAVESSTDAQANEAACKALCCLFSRFPESIEASLASFSVFPQLPTIMGDSSSNTRKHLCPVLLAMASKSPRAREVLLSNGLLPAAVATLSDRTEPEFATTLLELLSAVVLSAEARSVQLPANVAQAIIGVLEMNETHGDLQVKGCRALRDLLTVSLGPLTLDKLVPFVTRLVDQTDSSDSLRMEACGVLWAVTARYPDHNPTDLSSMMQSILSVMRMYGGVEFQAPFNQEVLFVASGALACVTACAVQTPIALESEDVDIIIACVYKVMELHREGLEIMSNILGAIHNLCIVHENLLIQCGIIVVVIDMMVENDGNAMIQERACAILAHFASSEDLQVNLSIVQTEGIDMLIGALAVYTTNAKIQALACRALSHLSIDAESRLLITSMGGFQLIVVAMTTHRDDTDLLESACSALLNLTADGEEEQMTASGIGGAVVQMMGRHISSCSFQETAMGVLQNFSMKGAYAKQVIGEAGGVEAVINAMVEYMGVPTLLERAFSTLWSLAVLDENQGRIQQAQGINAVVNGMMASIEYERVQKQGCGCLCTLATNAVNSQTIRSAGGVDAIVFAMRAHFGYEDLQHEACRALSSLAINAGTNEVMPASDDEINSIIQAMKRFPRSADIHFHGCTAFRNFLLSDTNRAVVKRSEDDVRQVVEHASSRFPAQCSEIARQIIPRLA